MCLPCLAFVVHLGGDMQYFSAWAGFLVASFQVLRFFLINLSSMSRCPHTLCIFQCRRLSESLLLLTVFPFRKMVQSCFHTLSLSSHSPLVPRPMTGEGANSFVSKTGCYCIWSTFAAPSSVLLSDNRKKLWGNVLPGREGDRRCSF